MVVVGMGRFSEINVFCKEGFVLFRCLGWRCFGLLFLGIRI